MFKVKIVSFDKDGLKGCPTSPQKIIVGVNDIESIQRNSLKGLIISPNPASGYIEIHLDNVILSKAKNPVKIYNTYGECVITVGSNCNEPLQRIDVSHLPVGIYFIQIGNYSEKFLVVR